MKRQKEADILGNIIRLARNGLTQASIAGRIGVKPSKVYKICKRYGIKTRRGILMDKTANAQTGRPVQLPLPI